MKTEEVVGTFQCPVCWQKYNTPEIALVTIRDHVRKHAGNERRTVRWIASRVKRKDVPDGQAQ